MNVIEATTCATGSSNTTGTATQTSDITVDTPAVTLLAANPNRKSALIQNVGAANIRVTYDGTTPTATHGHQLTPGATLELTTPNIPTTAVKAIRETGTSSTASVSEVT